MDFELRAAKEKWEREQRQRKEQARARVEREKKAREEALRQQEALEASQRSRRLEEAEAAFVAQQREEEDLMVGDGVKFNKMLKAIPIGGDGDKIRLPPSAFEDLSSQGALDKGPMIFEISSVWKDFVYVHVQLEEKEQTTHAGVLQFTAPEGFAELPPHVWTNSGLMKATGISNQQPLVRIRYVRLPKGTYAKLQPEVADFADLPNHKAVLETKLRHHATLSEGDLLSVQYGGIDYDLRVLELKPNSSVSVLETDIEVDVVEAALADAQSILVPITLGKPHNAVVDEGIYNYYKFSIDKQLADAASKGDVDVVLSLELDGGGAANDADLYVAMHPILFPTQHQHQWSSHDVGSKLVCLTGSGKTLHQGFYTVAVYGFRGESIYRILLQAQPSTQERAHGQRTGVAFMQGQRGFLQPSVSNLHAGEGFDLCGNCKQVVPARTITLHEAYCRRHNAVCQYEGCGVVLRREEMDDHIHCRSCGEAFRQEELEKHMKVYHEPQSCKCGAVLVKEEMVNHQASMCPLRLITCRFCGDLVQAGAEVQDLRDLLQGLTQHESVCGSRTSPCDSCGRAIMLKEMDLHTAAAHSGPYQVEGSIPFSFHTSAEKLEHTDASAIQVEDSGVLTKSVDCPICGCTFTGSGSEEQLNFHLDSQHFSAATPASYKNNSPNVGEVSELLNSQRRSLSVSCPICGLAVHSERDLSLHIDMVH